nr:MAG TPA: hypothetical protein [Caudoviricetes sp.]
MLHKNSGTPTDQSKLYRSHVWEYYTTLVIPRQGICGGLRNGH